MDVYVLVTLTYPARGAHWPGARSWTGRLRAGDARLPGPRCTLARGEVQVSTSYLPEEYLPLSFWEKGIVSVYRGYPIRGYYRPGPEPPRLNGIPLYSLK